jgi:hypothetical protein
VVVIGFVLSSFVSNEYFTLHMLYRGIRDWQRLGAVHLLDERMLSQHGDRPTFAPGPQAIREAVNLPLDLRDGAGQINRGFVQQFRTVTDLRPVPRSMLCCGKIGTRAQTSSAV